MVSLVSWSLGGVGMPARFHRSVFHSSRLSSGAGCQHVDGSVQHHPSPPVIGAARVKEDDLGCALDQPPPVDPLDAALLHRVERLGERRAGWPGHRIPQSAHRALCRLLSNPAPTHGSTLSTSIGAVL